MKRFMNILKNNIDIIFSIVATITIISAIFILVFEPFGEVHFIYNQF